MDTTSVPDAGSGVQQIMSMLYELIKQLIQQTQSSSGTTSQDQTATPAPSATEDSTGSGNNVNVLFNSCYSGNFVN